MSQQAANTDITPHRFMQVTHTSHSSSLRTCQSTSEAQLSNTITETDEFNNYRTGLIHRCCSGQSDLSVFAIVQIILIDIVSRRTVHNELKLRYGRLQLRFRGGSKQINKMLDPARCRSHDLIHPGFALAFNQ